MDKVRRILAVVAVLTLLTVFVFSGCAAKNGTDKEGSSETQATTQASSQQEETQKELAPVELVYYTPFGGPTTDVELVNAEMNKVLQSKINATLKINALGWGDYDQKMNVVNAAGEAYDIAFTAWWFNSYYKNISNGSIIALNDLLPQYAPNLWKTVPEALWDATKVKGKIYGAINYQIAVDNYGMTFDMEWLKNLKEKSGFDAGDLNRYKKLQDLEPILDAAKKASLIATGDISGFNVYPGFFKDMAPFWGYDGIGDAASAGWVKLTDSSLKVLNQYESEEFKAFMNLMNKWYKSGYIVKDIAVQKDAINKYKYWPPYPQFVKTGQDKMQGDRYGHEFKNTNLGITVATTSRATGTMMGISKTSKNPDRALMYLDLMASDPTLLNLLSNGIEGTHYVKLDDGTIDYPSGIDAKNTTYHPDMSWAFGNAFIGHIWKGLPLDINEGDLKLNESAQPSPIIGFSFDPEPVKTQIASCQAVLDEYIAGLGTGSVDPEKFYPEFISKLKTAGADEIVTEKQKQLDAWKASK